MGNLSATLTPSGTVEGNFVLFLGGRGVAEKLRGSMCLRPTDRPA